MNKIKSSILWLALFLTTPITRVPLILAANEDPGKGKGIDPATGKSFDYRKMVMSLLGLNEDCDEGAMSKAYNTAMTTDVDEGTKAITGKLQKANEDLQAFTSKRKAVKLTIGGETLDVTLADNEQEAPLTAAIQKAVTKITELSTRADKAEAAFANERNAHIETILRGAIETTRLTKAESETHRPLLANAKNPVEYDAAVKAITDRKPKNALIVSANLDRQSAPESSNASQKLITMVNEAMDKDPQKRPFDHHWNVITKSEQGRALLSQMKQPEKNPAFEKTK